MSPFAPPPPKVRMCWFCKHRPSKGQTDNRKSTGLCIACRMRLWRNGQVEPIMCSYLDVKKAQVQNLLHAGKSIYRCAKTMNVPYATMRDFIRTRGLA